MTDKAIGTIEHAGLVGKIYLHTKPGRRDYGLYVESDEGNIVIMARNRAEAEAAFIDSVETYVRYIEPYEDIEDIKRALNIKPEEL